MNGGRQRKTIACVAYLHGAGGAERQIVAVANALASIGYDVHLVILASSNSFYPIDSRVTIHDVSGREQNRRSILARFAGLSKVLFNIRPDVVINYWLQSAFFCAVLPKRIRGSIVYSERGDPADKEYQGVLSLVRKLAFGRTAAFVFQTREAQSFFPPRVQNRSAIIPNFLFVPDSEVWTKPQNRRPVILNVGRLEPQKNQLMLIKAFSLVKKKIDSAFLSIIGSGSLECELKNAVKDYGLEGSVAISPPGGSVLRLMTSSSMFVLSSSYEGMPNVLLEAMAVGCPCITTDYRPLGSVAALVNNNVDGLVVANDSPDELASAMIRLLAEDELANSLSEQARKIRGRHSTERILFMWESFLKEYAFDADPTKGNL